MLLGRPPLGYGVLVCFWLRRVILRGHFWRRVSIWHLVGIIFHVFVESWTYFFERRAPTGLLFCIMGPQGHTFAPLGAARPATRPQTGSPSRFLSPPPGSVFGSLFVTFAFFTGLSDFGKTEPLLKRELHFEGPGLFQMSLFWLWALSKIFRGFGCS